MVSFGMGRDFTMRGHSTLLCGRRPNCCQSSTKANTRISLVVLVKTFRREMYRRWPVHIASRGCTDEKICESNDEGCSIAHDVVSPL